MQVTDLDLEDTAPQGKSNTSREALMLARFGDDFMNDDAPVATNVPEVAEPVVEPVVQEVVTPVETADDFLSEKDFKRKTKIKVYGEEKEVDLETLIKKAQMSDAVEKKLEEASKKAAEAERKEKEVNERILALQEKEEAKKLQQEQESQKLPVKKGVFKEAISSLTDYDVEKSSTLFEEQIDQRINEEIERRIKATKQPEFDVEQITNKIKSELEAKQAERELQREAANAWERFNQEHKDIAGNEMLMSFFQMNLEKNFDPSKNIGQQFEENVKRVRSFTSSLGVKTVESTTAPTVTKSAAIVQAEGSIDAAKGIAVTNKSVKANKEDEDANSDYRSLYFKNSADLKNKSKRSL